MVQNKSKEKELEDRLLIMQNKLVKQNEDLVSEVEKKTNDLIKSERLATIGTMASRIAHDLKNPLTIMHTYAEMLTPEILSKLDSKDKEKWLRMQNSYLQWSRGTLSDEDWSFYKGLICNTDNSDTDGTILFETTWSAHKPVLTERFVKFVDTCWTNSQ